jgi:medium-chain acyl-[acyl-carrier-protein] hydrolase
LYCFPYSGGFASSIYLKWCAHLSAHGINVCPIEYPGRGLKHAQELKYHLNDLLESIYQEIDPKAPYAFFGHSLGALVAFEMARLLRRKKKELPKILFLSGRPAAHLKNGRFLKYSLSDEHLINELHILNGIPDKVLNDKRLINQLMPIIRADFAVNDTYTYIYEKPLDIIMCLYGGSNDPEASIIDIKSWKDLTTNECLISVFDGDHFFVNSHSEELLNSIVKNCSSYL